MESVNLIRYKDGVWGQSNLAGHSPSVIPWPSVPQSTLSPVSGAARVAHNCCESWKYQLHRFSSAFYLYGERSKNTLVIHRFLYKLSSLFPSQWKNLTSKLAHLKRKE